MKRGLLITLLVLGILIVAGALVCTGVFIGRRFMNASAYITGYPQAGWYGNGESRGYGREFGPGMPGMPGIMGQGMMDNFPHMNGWRGNTNIVPLSLDEARTSAETYLAGLDNSDLAISEIMIFDNNAYVVVVEKSTGLGAFELLVDPVTRVAYPEHGPNIMWNLKYGGLNHAQMMGNRGGMMNWMMGENGLSGTIPADVSAEMTVSPEEAIQAAQAFLDANLEGATAADPIQFYGYYTLDFERDGAVAGMLSVNGYNGQVFLHTWHGTFIEEMEYEH